MSCSAPGKVLICGGYLVVESPNPGISIGVSSRFTTERTEWTAADETTVTVISPQFGATFVFSATLKDGAVSIVQTSGPETPFIYNAVLFALADGTAAAGGKLPAAKVVLTLLASNDFYSQRNYLEANGKAVTAQTLREVPPHNPIVGSVSKTGLGSSAALTTSLVGALLRPMLATGEESVIVERVQRVAQIAHCVAQGKIGSGFDVYTAVYGTCEYNRFDKGLIEGLMGEKETAIALDKLSAITNAPGRWVSVEPYAGLPSGLRLLLGDVHQGGTSTPSMASKVFAWKKTVVGTEGNLWDRLAAANRKYIATLRDLTASTTDDATREALAVAPASAWKAESDLAAKWVAFHAIAAECRGLLRQMGESAAVEIEPPMLTPLLDATAALPGVVAVGCPGAGGFDALFALVLDGKSGDSSKAVEALWEGFPGLTVTPLPVREDAQGVAFTA